MHIFTPSKKKFNLNQSQKLKKIKKQKKLQMPPTKEKNTRHKSKQSPS
jgi:hypothetical protein